MNFPKQTKQVEPSKIWEEFGITQHLGGFRATRSLLNMCELNEQSRILDIGCGTGFSACFIAENLRSNVYGVEISESLLKMAKRRIVRHALKNVELLNCDAHELPFPLETFDVVVAESMLIFCDAKRVFHQVYRILKRNGIFAINELTLLRPPPKNLERWFWDLFRIRPRFKDDWADLFAHSGFVNTSSEVHSFEFQDDLASHLKIDGVTRYASSLLKSLAIPSLRSTFFSRDTLHAMIEFLPYVGYGLFTGRKQ